MDISTYKSKFTVSHRKPNIALEFLREIQKHMPTIPDYIIWGMFKHKKIKNIKPIFYEILKSDCKNPTALFIWKVKQLPTIKKPQKKTVNQLKLRLRSAKSATLKFPIRLNEKLETPV